MSAPPAITDCEALTPIPYPQMIGSRGESLGREAWLEQAIATYPDLLLLDRIDPHAAKPVLVGRQLDLPGRGPLDLLFLEVTGVLTLVETKLAENPELRRQVISQIFDYATHLADMSYDGLEGLLCSADQPLGDDDDLTAGLWRGSGRGEPKGNPYDLWSKAFKERVEDNLRRRRLRLLIVADRIDSRLRDVVEFVVGGTRPDFQVALVEITPYQLPDDMDRLLLIPSLHWSRTPTIPPVEFSGKVQWDEQTFLEQTRRNNADDEIAIQMIEEILSWMKKRAKELGPAASIEWPASSAERPCVNLRIRGVRNAIPHLEGVPGGRGWISCRDVMRQHPNSFRAFLERVQRLEPYQRLAKELLSGEKNDLKMTRDYLGDPTVRAEVLSAMADFHDSIVGDGQGQG